MRTMAVAIAHADYRDYASQFLYPSVTLMIETGLWLLLVAAIGFVVGLGLSSLMGQRTVPVILLIVLEVVLTPILSTKPIEYMLNAQRGLVGLATAHLEPGGLTLPFGGPGGGGPGGNQLLPESTAVAICVVIAWLVVWTVLGAWRMMTRDA
jgi:hypothetical protein